MMNRMLVLGLVTVPSKKLHIKWCYSISQPIHAPSAVIENISFNYMQALYLQFSLIFFLSICPILSSDFFNGLQIFIVVKKLLKKR
jgi:hypothetical protein